MTKTSALFWTRWRRGGGEYASHLLHGDCLYSLTPIKSPSGRNTGRFELYDFHWRQGRSVTVESKQAGQDLADQWLAEGPARDGHARMRTAWGDWHEQVPAGHVGVYVVLPETGEKVCGLITHEVYEQAHADAESRIPLDALDRASGFTPDSPTKQAHA